MTKGQVGRPPKYEHKEEIEGLIEEYFKKCEGEILKDEEGEVIFDKFGNPVIVGARPPTVTGLALALGFSKGIYEHDHAREINGRGVCGRAAV